MKKHILIALGGLIATSPMTFGEAPYERELTELKARRDKAVATAIEPINRRYPESLDQLLRKATQANDLDTALKIKTELGTAGAPLQTATANPARSETGDALTDLKLQLVGSKWQAAAGGRKLDFRPDGIILIGAAGGKHEVKARDKVVITIGNGKPQLLTLSRSGRQLEKQRGGPEWVLISAK